MQCNHTPIFASWNSILPCGKGKIWGSQVKNSRGKYLQRIISDLLFFRSSLIYFRGKHYFGINVELDEIIAARTTKGHAESFRRKTLKVINSHSFIKPFIYLATLQLLLRYDLEKNCIIKINWITLYSNKLGNSRLSAYPILTAYTSIFVERAGIDLKPTLGAVVVDLFRLIMAIAATFLLYIFTNKQLFLLSGTVGTCGIFAGRWWLNQL